jgi:2-haloacid dehalogenase
VRDIVFDLGGVLIDWDPRYLFRDHIGGDYRRVEEFLHNVCTPEWHRRLDAGASFLPATRELRERHPRHRDWIERYASDWQRMFRGAFPASVAFLQSLADRGFRLHALSNYPAEQIRFLYRSFPFMTLFDTVVLSGLVRATKPSESLYTYLLQRIGERDCLFVDDREENVAAARRCGMHAIRFTQSKGVAELAEILQRDA